jgi:hypothetical protein
MFNRLEQVRRSWGGLNQSTSRLWVTQVFGPRE